MVVTKVVPKSPSARIGINLGDIIRQINQDRIDTEEDYNKSISDLNNPDRILLLVQRGRQGYYVTLEPWMNEAEKKEIESLRETIHRHDHLYYVKNSPVVSDREYD